jgi:predicted secreted protein
MSHGSSGRQGPSDLKLDLTGAGAVRYRGGASVDHAISFNAETVDVTSLESQGGWRELLGGAGVQVRRSDFRGRGFP